MSTSMAGKSQLISRSVRHFSRKPASATRDLLQDLANGRVVATMAATTPAGGLDMATRSLQAPVSAALL